MPQSEIVRFGDDRQTVGGFLVRPDGTGPYPAVILTLAIAGLNDYIERVAERIAGRGIACLALDYYVREGSPPT